MRRAYQPDVTVTVHGRRRRRMNSARRSRARAPGASGSAGAPAHSRPIEAPGRSSSRVSAAGPDPETDPRHTGDAGSTASAGANSGAARHTRASLARRRDVGGSIDSDLDWGAIGGLGGGPSADESATDQAAAVAAALNAAAASLDETAPSGSAKADRGSAGSKRGRRHRPAGLVAKKGTTSQLVYFPLATGNEQHAHAATDDAGGGSNADWEHRATKAIGSPQAQKRGHRRRSPRRGGTRSAQGKKPVKSQRSSSPRRRGERPGSPRDFGSRDAYFRARAKTQVVPHVVPTQTPEMIEAAKQRVAELRRQRAAEAAKRPKWLGTDANPKLPSDPPVPKHAKVGRFRGEFAPPVKPVKPVRDQRIIAAREAARRANAEKPVWRHTVAHAGIPDADGYLMPASLRPDFDPSRPPESEDRPTAKTAAAMAGEELNKTRPVWKAPAANAGIPNAEGKHSPASLRDEHAPQSSRASVSSRGPTPRPTSPGGRDGARSAAGSPNAGDRASRPVWKAPAANPGIPSADGRRSPASLRGDSEGIPRDVKAPQATKRPTSPARSAPRSPPQSPSRGRKSVDATTQAGPAAKSAERTKGGRAVPPSPETQPTRASSKATAAGNGAPRGSSEPQAGSKKAAPAAQASQGSKQEGTAGAAK